MITGDSRQQIIPPTRSHVKAGFVVYTPNEGDRSIVILDEGKLAAIDTSGGQRKVVFEMQPGDLVGVASLLERETFRYTLEAVEDSQVTYINEDCMESALKTLPVWMLAVVKSLSAKTRKLKEDVKKPRSANTLKSLAEFCKHKMSKVAIPLTNIIQEFHWQTKIPFAQIKEDLKALARRKFIILQQEQGESFLKVQETELLGIFVDYQTSIEEGSIWYPFRLSLLQKKILVYLSTLDASENLDSPSWLTKIQQRFPQFDVTQWIQLQQFQWFVEKEDGTFVINADKVNYYLTALRYETNIRGVL